VELGPCGITVNAIMPGMMDTAMTEGVSQRVKEIEARRSLTRQLTSVEDVAAAVAFLASASAAQITGSTLCVDGGARL
jgi:3-oxoacyl-[acyl-carrier protein] reductase